VEGDNIMKVLLMGVGGQGGPAASIMASDNDIDKIVIGDINTDMAKKVQEKIGSNKIEIKKVDARDIDDIATAAEGMDVVLDLVTPQFYYNILQGALKAKTNYVNTAYDKFMWDNKMELGKKPKLYDEFVACNKTAMLGCGMSSGYTNVIAKLYIDKCDTVKSVKVRLAKKDLSIGKYGDAVTAWNPGWNPIQALLDFKLPSTVFRDKKYELKTKPFSEIEEWEFPEPMGKMPVSLHAHEEPYSIPLSFASKGLEYCDFKYYVNMQIAPVIALGLASDEPIEVDGVKVKPLDVVLSKVPKPGDIFLNEDPSTFDYLDKNKIVSMMVEVKGKKDGKDVTYNVYIPTMGAPRRETYEHYGTFNVQVALPAVTGSKVIVDGEAGKTDVPKGVIFPHDLDPKYFLKVMEKSGFTHRFKVVNA